jgi:hypothetical protein
MNIVLTTVKFNLQWYGRVMRDVLFRYKLLAVFIILLVCPTLASILNLLTFPLKSLFSYPVTNVKSMCAALFFYQVVSIIWISIQSIVLFKQPWQKYLDTLQFSNTQKKIIDVSLLLFVDIILCIPLFLAAAKSITESSHSILLIIIKLIAFIFMTLLTQISWIKSKYDIWLAVLMVNLLIIYSSVSFSELSQSVLVVLLVPVTYLLINNCYESKPIKSTHEKKLLTVSMNRVNYKKSFPILRTLIKNLIDHASQLTILFSAMLVISLLAMALTIYGETNPHLGFFLSIMMLINSLSASNIFNRVNTQWEEHSSYLSSLPMSKIILFKNNLLIASSITIFFNMIIIVVAEFIAGNFLATKIMMAFPLTIVFLVFAYIPQIKFRTYGFFVSLFLMFGFMYFDYLLI